MDFSPYVPVVYPLYRYAPLPRHVDSPDLVPSTPVLQDRFVYTLSLYIYIYIYSFLIYLLLTDFLL